MRITNRIRLPPSRNHPLKQSLCLRRFLKLTQTLNPNIISTKTRITLIHFLHQIQQLSNFLKLLIAFELLIVAASGLTEFLSISSKIEKTELVKQDSAKDLITKLYVST